MAFRSNDRVKETSTTTGTGNLTLLGAVAQFQAFSVFANNDTFFYAIVGQTGTEWEVGIGTYVSATPALARTTVLESSNADALVSFSAGTKDVFVTHPSQMMLQMKQQAAAPAAADTNWITQYAIESGTPVICTRDEFGLFDVLSRRDMQRTRKLLFIGQGSDTLSSATDFACIGLVTAAAEGTIANVAGVANEGPAKNFLTSATIDADAGILPNSFTTTQLALNPDITIKFRVNTTVTRRVWIGWVEFDHIASDTVASTHKFALRLSTTPAVTGFTIVHSNGTTETVEAQIQASDTGIHTIRLIADNANSRWGYSFDGAAVVWISANIPTANQLMGFQCQIRTTVAAAADMDYWWMDGTQDK